jgi:UDP-glucose 4-epimerase
MTVLVTGGAGFIGSHMVRELLDAGEQVVVLDNLSTGFLWAVPTEAELVVGDVGNIKLVSNLISHHRVNSIIHFAASVIVPESIADPLGYYQNNTANSRSLIDSAVKGGVKHFIFSSTAAVYGNTGDALVSEDAPKAPLSPYGSSKLMTETILRDASIAHGLGYAILRYFNVAGADPQMRTGQSTPNATHLIKTAVRTALGLNAKLSVFGNDYPTPDGTCVRDYIHVSDLARAHLDSLRHLRGGGESATLNCGYGHGFSVLDVIDAVKRVSGADFQVEIGPRRPGDPARIVADCSRIRKVLGFAPRFDDLQSIVKHALAWEETLTKKAQSGHTHSDRRHVGPFAQ